MIDTVADLLEAMIAAERVLLNAEEITHRPTIGAMWEDLSQDIMRRSLPCKGLGVSSGFIEGSEGRLSAEMDCLLVNGPGRAIHRSDKRIYQPDEVIAIIQVKKRLYQSDIRDGFNNLISILSVGGDWDGNVRHTVRRAFEIITRTPLPGDVTTLPLLLREVYNALVGEAVLPCRIILGYHGFANERTFRQGLIELFESLDATVGWGPVGFPSFIIGPNAVAMKNTAMPWGAPIRNGRWPLILTNGSISPSMALLQAVWTRLNHLNLVGPDIFGDDLLMEAWTPLIGARIEDDLGWRLSTADANLCDRPEPIIDSIEWSPVFVGAPAFDLVRILGAKDPEPLDLSEFGDDPGIEGAVRELVNAGIAGRDISNQSLLRLLTTQCDALILPDGRFAVGENNSGRLFRWLDRFMDEYRARQKP